VTTRRMPSRFTRGACAAFLLLALAALSQPAPTAWGAARQASVRCTAAPLLTGVLRVTHASCSRGRRAAYGYFTHTQPARHVGPARVGAFRCYGRFDGRFVIRCRAGRAGVYFRGFAAR